MRRFAIGLAALLSLTASGCGQPTPAEPDPEKLRQLVAEMEARESAGAPASAGEQEKAEQRKARRTEEMIGTLERSLPPNIDDDAAGAMLAE